MVSAKFVATINENGLPWKQAYFNKIQAACDYVNVQLHIALLESGLTVREIQDLFEAKTLTRASAETGIMEGFCEGYPWKAVINPFSSDNAEGGAL